jgi:putative selenate reductase molybdopterin-binding subunit
MNPMQCRGASGGWRRPGDRRGTLRGHEDRRRGQGEQPDVPRLPHPAFADIPRTEIYFADTYDRIGPLGAKSMSESPYNPVAAALGIAIRDAIGVRLYATPFKADHLYKLVPNAAMPPVRTPAWS